MCDAGLHSVVHPDVLVISIMVFDRYPVVIPRYLQMEMSRHVCSINIRLIKILLSNKAERTDQQFPDSHGKGW